MGMSIIWAILVFCLLIISHEFGHFIVAKANRIFVYDFSLGMGPKLWQHKGKETEYTLRLFPIGGSVRMMGEDESVDDPRSFNHKAVWRRMSVIFAGPLTNFIVAILLFAVVFTAMGMPSAKNIVGNVSSGLSAEAAGILPGDVIEDINGVAVTQWADIITIVQDQEKGQVQDAGKPLQIKVQRDGEMLTVQLTPTYNKEAGYWMLGVTQSIEKVGFFSAIALGIKQSFQMTVQLLQALFLMLTHQMPVDVTGPVGIVNYVGQAANAGFQNLLYLTAYLSLNLGVINLLPLPALDGSRLVFLAIEGIRRKPVNREKEGMVHFVGLMILFALMIIITYQDIARLFNGG